MAATAQPPLTEATPALRTWQVLQHEVAECTRCPLHEGRTTAVFGDGDPDSGFLIVGEAPGRHEDLTGKPFAGATGNLLGNLLAEAGMRREQTYLVTLVRCRPPDGRPPQPEEVEACVPYLREQIAALQPRVIVTLGELVTRAVLRRDLPVSKIAGYRFDLHGATVIPTYDPAAALRGSPTAMAALRRDLRIAKGVLDGRVASARDAAVEMRTRQGVAAT